MAETITPTPRHLEAALRAFGWKLTVEQALADRFKRPMLEACAKAMARVEQRMAEGLIRTAAPSTTTPLPWRRSGAFDARRAAAGDLDDQ